MVFLLLTEGSDNAEESHWGQKAFTLLGFKLVLQLSNLEDKILL